MIRRDELKAWRLSLTCGLLLQLVSLGWAALLESRQPLPGLACSALHKLDLAYNFTLDQSTMEHSTVNSGGSSHRFNAFLHKWVNAPAGGQLSVVIQGGSFSSGAGLNPPESLYAERMVRLLQKLRPDVHIKLTNSAVGKFSGQEACNCVNAVCSCDALGLRWRS